MPLNTEMNVLSIGTDMIDPEYFSYYNISFVLNENKNTITLPSPSITYESTTEKTLFTFSDILDADKRQIISISGVQNPFQVGKPIVDTSS